MSSLEALLKQLVRIPSVNPRNEARPAETALAEFVAEWAERRGMTAELHEVVDGRCNVLVTVPGDSADALLLETHLDTVETTGMSVEPFEPTVTDGVLHGRGACDAKGLLAVLLAALDELARTGPRPHTVTLACVIDEEHHYRGVQALRRRGLPALGAVVANPPRSGWSPPTRGACGAT